MKSSIRDLPLSIEESHKQLVEAWGEVTKLKRQGAGIMHAAADAQEHNLKLEAENQVLRNQNASLVQRLLKYEPVELVAN